MRTIAAVVGKLVISNKRTSILLAGRPLADCKKEQWRKPGEDRSTMSDRMEPSIYKYILRHSLRGQIILLAITAASMPFVYLALDVPKTIINNAIGGRDIPESLLGFELTQVHYLFLLCGIFIGLVIINGGLKYIVNVYRGILGERMLRRFRYELYTRVLRFPIPHFKRVSQGEIIPMITAETEPLGGFIGDAFALPAFQGGLLVTYLIFIFNQDVLLGIGATALYPFQMYVIPKLQSKVNQLGRRRVLAVRELAARIGDSVSGVTEIRANDTSRYERADITRRLGSIFDIRYEIYRRKFFIKFLNNFIAQITPFFFYAVGGYLVIQGELSLGALVAVLAAYKDLSSPWKELLKYYQITEDIRVKYAQIIEQFQPDDMLHENLLDAEPEQRTPLAGSMVSSNLGFSEDGVVYSVDSASFQLDLKEHTAVVGRADSGKDDLARLISRLLTPSAGRINTDQGNLHDLPLAVTGRQIAYVEQGAHLFAGDVRDNLFYGLKNKPVSDHEYEGEAAQQRAREAREARAAGNSSLDINANWVENGENLEALEARTMEVLDVVNMTEDIFLLGLRSKIDSRRYPEVTTALLEARSELQQRLGEDDLGRLMEPFDEARYNTNSSVAENLLFGIPRDSSLKFDELVEHEYVNDTLEETGLLTDLMEIGQQIAETMVDIFADLPPGHEFFEQFSFISSDDLPEFKALLARIGSQGMEAIETEERARLLSLVFKVSPARHRLGLINEDIQQRLLEARRRLAENMPAELRDSIALFSADKYNDEASVQDNILFGKLAYGQANADTMVADLIRTVVDNLGIRGDIMRVGLGFNVGVGGARVSPEQRQTIALARGLLKNPDVLVVNDAISTLDTASEAAICTRVREYMAGRGLVWVSGDARLVSQFDRILVMDSGKIIEQGTSEELERSGRAFQQLLGSA